MFLIRVYFIRGNRKLPDKQAPSRCVVAGLARTKVVVKLLLLLYQRVVFCEMILHIHVGRNKCTIHFMERIKSPSVTYA